MQELIDELVQKVGLSEEDAAKSVDTMRDFIKGKLPPMFADKFDDMVNGKLDTSALLSAFMGGNPLDKLKHMFGKQ